MFVGNISLRDLMKDFKKTNIINVQKNRNQVDRHHPYQLEKELNRAFVNGDINALEKISHAYENYEAPILCSSDPIRSLKNNMICTCALITRIAMKAGLEEKYAYYLSDLYIEKIESMDEASALHHLNSVMMLDFISQIKSGLVYDRLSPIIESAQVYINEHLNENLSLKHVAEKVGVSESHLSRSFKQETSMTFSNYVHTIKVKKAQHLLLLTDKSIIDIGLSLGFTTQSHFTKVFKSITDTTPLQYKKQHQSVVN